MSMSPLSRGSSLDRTEELISNYEKVEDETLAEEIDAAEKGLEIPPSKGLQGTATAQDWTGPDDPENPTNWPLWQKVYHTTIPGVFGFAVTFGSSVYTPGYPEVMEKFNVSSTVALLGLSLYVLGLGFGPVLAAPISETKGRREGRLPRLFTTCRSLHSGCRFLAKLRITGHNPLFRWLLRISGPSSGRWHERRPLGPSAQSRCSIRLPTSSVLGACHWFSCRGFRCSVQGLEMDTMAHSVPYGSLLYLFSWNEGDLQKDNIAKARKEAGHSTSKDRTNRPSSPQIHIHCYTLSARQDAVHRADCLLLQLVHRLQLLGHIRLL